MATPTRHDTLPTRSTHTPPSTSRISSAPSPSHRTTSRQRGGCSTTGWAPARSCRRTSAVPASAAFILGQLAEALDRPDRALRHYTDALAFEHRCEAHALGARTRAALDAVAR